uniref:RGS domain-containing protein n=1 Tax=Oncorhynchus kisutch TaxID=8019 RepID=A0A8C7L915_ONCKI
MCYFIVLMSKAVGNISRSDLNVHYFLNFHMIDILLKDSRRILPSLDKELKNKKSFLQENTSPEFLHHQKIKTSMKSPGLCFFDEAVRKVYRLMERDSCPRFLRSDAYLGFRCKARTL